MIMEILANTLKIVNDRHIFFLEMFRRAYAGEHQEFGGPDGPCGHNHFACRFKALKLTTIDDFNANGAALSQVSDNPPPRCSACRP